MTDDPHDATWITPPRKEVWCAVHCEPMETCPCGRDGNVLGWLLLFAAIGVIIALALVALYRL